MKYLIGENSISLKLSTKYFDMLNEDSQYLLNKCQILNNFRLSSDDLKYLFNNLYLNENFPFGKKDRFIDIGKIDLNYSRVEIFYNEVIKSISIINSNIILKENLNKHIKAIIPLTEIKGSSFRNNGSGSSIHWIKGGVFLSLPYNKIMLTFNLAINIIHELGHQCLMTFQQADRLIEKGHDILVYSAIRKTMRPSILSFHALVAIYFMLYFIINLDLSFFSKNEKLFINDYFKKLKYDFILGLYSLKNVPWTPLGLEIYNEIFEFSLELK